MILAQNFAAYSDWRNMVSIEIQRFRGWLEENELQDSQTEMRLAQVLDSLRQDRLTVAFVAEFSRGKSELINAIFFANYGTRMLPSSAGRTTMCPTELLYDYSKIPAIELLPIETRLSNASVSEYKAFPGEWKVIPLKIDSAPAVQDALKKVSEVIHVNPETAIKYGFDINPDGENKYYQIDADGLIEIPRWRHAVINFPHPLLEQGLVILDTPGLNAVGAEPGLTLNLLPNAHAILFVLAADTGVTQSDLTFWRENIGSGFGSANGRIVVLNKIDGMWDELKTGAEIEGEIRRQVHTVGSILELPESRIFPVSAQKGLVAKVTEDTSLLKRSRLEELEYALSDELIPAKWDIVRDNTNIAYQELASRIKGLLATRLGGLSAQLEEMSGLRSKNRGVVEYMMNKVRAEKADFETGLQRYNAVRSVLSSLTNNLFSHLGLDALRTLTVKTREAMLSSTLARKLSEAMAEYFSTCRQNLNKSAAEINEITTMMDVIYRKFTVEHGLNLASVTPFSLQRYEKEFDRLESWCTANLNPNFLMFSLQRKNITQKFFEEVAVQVRRSFERANRDAEAWLKTITAPIEAQVRERQVQLKRRLESIKRIHQATDSLEDKLKELKASEEILVTQLRTLEDIENDIARLLDQTISARERLAKAS